MESRHPRLEYEGRNHNMVMLHCAFCPSKETAKLHQGISCSQSILVLIMRPAITSSKSCLHSPLFDTPSHSSPSRFSHSKMTMPHSCSLSKFSHPKAEEHTSFQPFLTPHLQPFYPYFLQTTHVPTHPPIPHNEREDPLTSSLLPRAIGPLPPKQSRAKTVAKQNTIDW